MEELLNLTNDIYRLQDFKMTYFGYTKVDSMHFVMVYIVNGEQKTIDLELNNRNRKKVKEHVTSIVHKVVFANCEPLRAILTLLDRDTQRVIDKAGIDSLEQWLSYDMTAYLPWCHKFPHLDMRGHFSAMSGENLVTQKMGALLDYFYNNACYESIPDLEEIGSSLGWADKAWLTNYFNLYEFCMVLIDSFSFNVTSFHWQNYDDEFVYFTINVLFKVSCYHDAQVSKNKSMRPIRVKMDPSITAIEHYKMYNYGVTKLDMILPCMLKVPKQVIADKIKWWTEQHGINFFIH